MLNKSKTGNSASYDDNRNDSLAGDDLNANFANTLPANSNRAQDNINLLKGMSMSSTQHI